MGLLGGGWLHHDIFELPVPALMGEAPGRGPRLDDDVERLVEAGLGFLHGNAKSVELVVAVTLAYSQVQAPAREQVQGCRLLGQEHGIVPGQHHYRRSDPQRRGPRGNPREQIERRRYLVPSRKVMLDEKRTVISEGFGLDRELDVIP